MRYNLEGGQMAQRKNIGEIVAVSWLLIAIVMTILIGPSLGARGLLWMGIHHFLCLVGSIHELTKKRRKQRSLSLSRTAPLVADEE